MKLNVVYACTLLVLATEDEDVNLETQDLIDLQMCFVLLYHKTAQIN